MERLLLTGQKFGRLTVADLAASDRMTRWHVRCDCGSEFICRGTSLTSGHTKSCGCLSVEVSTTHGQSKSPEFKAWQMMIQRCTNPKHPKFEHWGGRGITVCPRWLGSFESFISDMGSRPSDRHSLDRHPDNDGNYEPGNCRWATYSQQNENRRSNGLLGKISAKKGKHYARPA